MSAVPFVPEIYFLTGIRNRTRAIFDFLGGAEGSSAVLRARFPDGERIGHFEFEWRA